MSLSEINKREKDFHNKLHLSEELKREKQGKFYKALYALYSDFLNILKDGSDGDIELKTILKVKPNYLLKIKNARNKYFKVLLVGDSCFRDF